MQLTKHHGLGNDFLVVLDGVNGRALAVDGDLARRVCDRRTGIGADGLIHGATPEAGSDADVVMHLYNADGGRAEMSGNGVRCLAHAVVLAAEEREAHLQIDTDGGRRDVVVRAWDNDGRVAWTEAAMGKVRPGPEVPPSVAARLADPGPGHAHRYATADVGNPHLVVEVDDPAAIDLHDLGAWIEQQFPEGINVEFVPRAGNGPVDEIDLRVWERGAGETQACGTGACAVAAVLHDWGVTAPPDGEPGARLQVHMPGGDAQVRLSGEGELALSGDVHLVATVELPDG